MNGSVSTARMSCRELIEIARMRWAQLGHSVTSWRGGDMAFRTSVVGGCFALLWLGGYAFFYRALKFLSVFPGVGPLLMDRVLVMLFVTMFGMLVFSNVIVAFTTFFRTREMHMLWTMPLQRETVFWYKTCETLTLSSWAPCVLMIPLLVAFGQVQQAPWLFYGTSIVLMVPFLIIAATVGVSAVMLLMRWFPVIGDRLRGWGAVAAVTAGSVGVWLLMRMPQVSQVTHHEVAAIMNEIMRHTAFARIPWSPHYWISHGLLAAANGEFRTVMWYGGLLLSNALMGGLLAWYVVRKWIYSAWARTNSVAVVRQFPAMAWWERGLGWIARPFRTLLIKDAKVFLRDPTQWTQVVIFFGILAVYILTLRRQPYDIAAPVWKHMISFLNLAATALVMAMLNIRFVFPLLSLEGKRFWILELSPMSVERLLMQKFWVSALASICITETLVVLSNVMLKVGPLMMIISCSTILLMCFAVAGLTVGLGARFPNFREENPARIVSGFGGTVLLVLCLCYVAVVVSLEASPLYWYLTGQLPSHSTRVMAAGVVISLIALVSAMFGVIPMRLGLNHLRSFEL